MKISKLFHWLYAFLMLLPVFALMPSMFYFAFNQKSENYTHQSVTETYEYETNEVNSANDLIEGNIYKASFTTEDMPNNTNLVSCFSFYHLNYIVNANSNNVSIDRSDILEDNYYYSINRYDNLIVFACRNINDTYITGIININISYNETLEFYFVYHAKFLYANFVNNISASDYLGEKSVTITESDQSPMNIFYTSVDKLFTMPIFAWAKTSFLVTPFTFIGNLFGLQATSPVIYMLSYWLAISIVWLVFDLIMYVPLLVHRWIDKGIVE